MRKRPLCAICILFLVIQGIRVLFFGVEEMEASALEKAVSYETQVELAGTVYKIEEKKKVMAVFLKDNIVSVAGQIINESDILIYISKNETEQPIEVKIGNRIMVRGEAESFEGARNPGNFDQKTYYLRQGIHVLVWADQVSLQSDETDPVRQFLTEFRGKWNDLLVRHLGEYYGGTMSAVLLGISHLLAINSTRIKLCALC